MSLQDDFDVLAVTVPTVPQDIAKVLEASADYVDAVRDLISRLDNKREMAAILQEKLREGLSAMQKSAEKQQTALQEALKAADDAVTAAIDNLEKARGGVEDQVEKATGEMASLQSALSSAGDEAKTAQQQANEKLDELVTGLGNDLAAFGTAVSSAGGAADNLEEAIAAAGSGASEGMNTLKTTLDAIESLAGRYLDDTRTRRVEPPVGQMKDKVGDAIDDLASRNAKLFNEVVEPTEEVGSGLVDVMKQVDEHGETLGELVFATQEELPETREKVAVRNDLLDQRVAPLQEAATAAEGMAAKHDLSW